MSLLILQLILLFGSSIFRASLHSGDAFVDCLETFSLSSVTFVLYCNEHFNWLLSLSSYFSIGGEQLLWLQWVWLMTNGAGSQRTSTSKSLTGTSHLLTLLRRDSCSPLVSLTVYYWWEWADVVFLAVSDFCFWIQNVELFPVLFLNALEMRLWYCIGCSLVAEYLVSMIMYV